MVREDLDVKLCSALNSFWPSVAPNATRTFALSPPEWDAATSVPLMDEELGLYPDRPDLPEKYRKSKLGWDGEYGPFFEQKFQFVNHAHIEQSDYVSHALAGEISLAGLASINAIEMFRRMTATRDAIAVLPEKPPAHECHAARAHHRGSCCGLAVRSDRGSPAARRRLPICFRTFGTERIPSKAARSMAQESPRNYTWQVSRTAVCWKREALENPFCSSFDQQMPAPDREEL